MSTPSISSPACCGSNVYDRNQQVRTIIDTAEGQSRNWENREKLCLPQASPHLHVVGAMFTTETNRLEQLLTRLRDNREIKIGQSSFSLWTHDKG